LSSVIPEIPKFTAQKSIAYAFTCAHSPLLRTLPGEGLSGGSVGEEEVLLLGRGIKRRKILGRGVPKGLFGGERVSGVYSGDCKAEAQEEKRSGSWGRSDDGAFVRQADR